MPLRKFTPALGDEIVAHIPAGTYYQTAAKAVGIHNATLYSWLQAGDQGDDPEFAEFAEKVREADALAEIDAVAKVREAKQGCRRT